jgi:soluble lytic murein transglycosylase-like protein
MISRRQILVGVSVAALTTGCASATPASITRVSARPAGRGQIMSMVVREANNLGVSPSLALAVAHAESNFNPRALSPVGARGVLQIMPATARGEYGIAADRLWDPRTNIRLGLHFLKRLQRRYGGRTDLALSHYNGGSAVGRPPNARVIPATRPYVAKVQRLQQMYRRRILNGDLAIHDQRRRV